MVYPDPPFNSDRIYNVLFKEHDGSRAASQIRAFEDTWQWDEAAIALWKLLGASDMMTYMAMMPPARGAPESAEAGRQPPPALRPPASLDLRLLLNSVFGPARFRTEVIWKRTSAHSDTKQGR